MIGGGRIEGEGGEGSVDPAREGDRGKVYHARAYPIGRLLDLGSNDHKKTKSGGDSRKTLTDFRKSERGRGITS